MPAGAFTVERLPQLKVEKLQVTGDEVLITGHLSHMVGVRLGRAWLYRNDGYSFVSEVTEIDSETRRARLTTSQSALDCGLVVGAVFPYFYGYWEPFQIDLVRRVDAQWVRVKYIPEPGYAIDHEQCSLCREKIGPRFEPEGYRQREDLNRPNRQGAWVCARCYGRYVAPHDLSFINEL